MKKINHKIVFAGFLAVIFVAAFFIQIPSVLADTHVSETISTNETWTLGQSPYIVDDTIEIPVGVTLTIEPGVIVKFNPPAHASIYTHGNLIANGDENNKIYFTSNYDDTIGGNTDGDSAIAPFMYDWDSIYFFNSHNNSIKNAVFRYAYENIYLDSSYLNLKNVEIYNGSFGVFTKASTLDADVLSCTNLASSCFTMTNSSNVNWTNSSIDTMKGTIIVNSSTLNLSNFSIKNILGDNAISVFNNGFLNADKLLIKDITSNIGYGIEVFNSGHLSLNHSTFKNCLSRTCISAHDNYGSSSIDIENSILDSGSGSGVSIYGESNISVKINNSVIKNFSTFSIMNDDPSFIVQAKNNWWGNATGPRNLTLNPSGTAGWISNNVDFTPWLTQDPFAVGNSSVLFLPGIEASRLYKQKTILEIPTEDQLWEPNWNSDVEDLYLNTAGISINPNIYTRDVIKESNTPVSMGPLGLNIYKSFSNMMDKLVSDRKIAEWLPFAYDWRYGVDDVVNNGTKYQNGTVSLVDTLQALADSSQNGKVTIIAHSNGGLLAKALLKKLQDDKNAGKNNLIDSVDKLILVATPEIGTASAVPALLNGYDQAFVYGLLMNETHARELARNSVGAYGLLPSQEYLNRVSASPVTFVDTATPSNVTTKLVQAFGSVIDSYAEYKNFLFGSEGRINPTPSQTNLPISLSQNLFTKAESLHDSIDAFVPPAGMQVIELAGWGIDTIASFEYYPKEESCLLCAPYTIDERPRFTADGDKTVVVPSAQYMSSIGKGSVEKYWVNLETYNESTPDLIKESHANILETSPLLNLISNTIQKLPLDNSPYISTTTPIETKNRLRISIHSPVTLDAYDADGNHTGKICPSDSDFCYVEENIPNSSYLEFGEGTYLNLPEDKVKSIKLEGTDVGTFTYDSEKVLSGGTSTISSFVDIPVTTQTEAEVVLNPTTQMPQLKLDVTGDGTIDYTLTPNSTFDPITYLQIMKTTIDSLDLSKAQIKAFDNRVDGIIKSIQKGKINKAKLKAEIFKKVLEKKLARFDRKHPRIKKLSKTDAQLLLDMLNKLLDNLS